MAQGLSPSYSPPFGSQISPATGNLIVKERGFTLLSPGVSPDADVFFIHGLQGHPRATWTYPAPRAKENPAQEHARKPSFRKKFKAVLGQQDKEDSAPAPESIVYWPLDLLSKDFPNVRTFTFGYDSHVTNWFKGPAMQLDIYSYGESLLNGLEARRRDDPRRPLIFIVHSLGGLVLKDALRRSRSANEDRFRDIYLSTKAIFFFGTPHRGGSYVNLGLTAQKILACSGFDTNDKLLRDLRFDSSTAKLLSEEFSRVLDETRPKVYTFQEAMGLSGFGPLSGRVVEDSSSALDYPLQEKDIIHANHVNMCRFSGFDDDGYEKTKAALSHCLSMSFNINTMGAKTSNHQQLLASLHLSDAQERFDQVEDAFEGTFGWLFENQQIGFADWLKQGQGIFWISGKPASGKSTLLKYAVSNKRTYDYLHENSTGKPWICGDFFFTNRGKDTQKSINGLFQRILYQILSQVPGLKRFVEHIFNQIVAVQGSWNLVYLEDALLAIVKQRKVPLNICLFIDALDEHDEAYHENHARLVELLQRLIESSDRKTVKVMLCLTSRPENVFNHMLGSCPGFRIHEHTQRDIRTYLHGRMDKYLYKRPDLRSDPNIMTALSSTFKEILRRAQGVFLWVKLIVTDMEEGLTDGEDPFELGQNLAAIPGDGDLEELYSGILLRLRSNYLVEAFLMLQIVYSAVEPVPSTELFQALDITRKGSLNYDWSVPREADKERRILSRCRGFLEVQQSFSRDEQGIEYHTPVVQFLHQSVKEFLRDSRSFEDMRDKLRPTWTSPPSWLPENGYAFLLRYRVCQHLHRYGVQPSEVRKLARFDLRKFDVLYHAYMVEMTLQKPLTEPLDALADFADANWLVPCYMKHEGWIAPPSWQPIFLTLAVQAGLLLYVQYFCESRIDINRLEGRPLLHYSVNPEPKSLCQRKTDPFLRSSNMVKLLAQLGANVHQSFEGLTAFAFAFNEFSNDKFKRDQLRILETLIRLGSSTEDPVAWRQDGASLNLPMTALQMAVRMDNVNAARLLIDYNASTDVLTDDEWAFLRKGYLYGDKPPKFKDEENFTKEEQLQRWLSDRERAIREGRNRHPILVLIDERQERGGRGIRYNRSRGSSPLPQSPPQRYEYTSTPGYT
ncbi:MAG: hypothetical protein M1814_001334 [Vezdaea aestivalis]|nr:MAG: hypothetical protein M1814_001334 [Vezdaea aestivalis]